MKANGQQKTVPVVLIRHAQSQWNLENRVTGWADPPLTEAGITEARQAGACLRHAGYRFDTAFSSCLQRAHTTLDNPARQPWPGRNPKLSGLATQ